MNTQESAAHTRPRSTVVSATTRIAGVLRFTTVPHLDDRGFFCRTFDADVMRDAGIDPHAFVQDSLSRSPREASSGASTSGAERGRRNWCGARSEPSSMSWSTSDHRLRRSSHGRVSTCEATSRPLSMCRRGARHGFQVVSDLADVSYRIDRPHDPAEDRVIAFDDPQLQIPWPLPVSMMSTRDRAAPPLSEYLDELTRVGAG